MSNTNSPEVATVVIEESWAVWSQSWQKAWLYIWLELVIFVVFWLLKKSWLNISNVSPWALPVLAHSGPVFAPSSWESYVAPQRCHLNVLAGDLESDRKSIGRWWRTLFWANKRCREVGICRWNRWWKVLVLQIWVMIEWGHSSRKEFMFVPSRDSNTWSRLLY